MCPKQDSGDMPAQRVFFLRTHDCAESKPVCDNLIACTNSPVCKPGRKYAVISKYTPNS